MIGEKVEFRNPDREGFLLTGKVMDKINEERGRVARGWAISEGSNNVGIQDKYTYYMIAVDSG